MSHHKNNGACPHCAYLFNRYPGFSVLLRTWFEKMQKRFPEFHCAEASRGRIDQEIYYHRRSSRASWGESAHNYGCGLDTFWMIDGKYNLSRDLYERNIVPNIPDWLQWGAFWKTFPELPHFELKSWRTLAEKGLVVLVEPMPNSEVA